LASSVTSSLADYGKLNVSRGFATPNAAPQPPLEVGATQERTL